ncbi:MAG: hypothetical protein P1U83_10485 [Roseovarius sp.]|nr:hypothetical protein [Roseovarius sp.]
MSFEFFLDWRPCAVTSYSVRTFQPKEKSGELASFVKHAHKLGFPEKWVLSCVDNLIYAYRSDGLFLFGIDFSEQTSPKERSSLVCVASSYIKTSRKHDHFYDRTSLTPSGFGRGGPLNKFPVKVDHTNFGDNIQDYLHSVISDETKLIQLASSSEYGETQSPDDSDPAILRLRNKYAALFDRSMKWCRETKYKKTFGIPLFSRTYYFAAVFLVLMIGVTTLQLGFDANSNVPSKFWIVLSGLVASIAAIVFAELIFKFLAVGYCNLILPVAKSIVGELDGTHQQWLRRVKRSLQQKCTKVDVFLFIALTGFVVFPISEVPHVLSILKLLGPVEQSQYYKSMLSALSAISFVEVSSESGFITTIARNSSFYLPFLVFTIYTLDVKTRRKNVIRVYTNLIGHLRFANILDDIVLNMFLRAKSKQGTGSKVFVPVRNGFGDAIDVVKDRLNSEVDNRTRNRLMMFAALTISLYFSGQDYLKTLADWFGVAV